MTDSLKLSDREIAPADLVAFITELDLLPYIIKRYIERTVCSDLKLSESDQIAFQQSFLAREKISTPEALQAWLDANDINEPQLSKQIYHALQLKQFKHQRFSSQVQTTFLENKTNLDQVMYSMIRTSERAKASELHLRIFEEESTFGDLAANYSEGIEQQFNGLIGPIELGRINPSIAERLRVGNEGQLWDPFELEGWWLLLRLEKSIPARLDDAMQERIIDDLYNAWIRKKIKEELQIVSSSNPAIRHILTPQAIQSSQISDSGDQSDVVVSKASLFQKVWDKISTSSSR